MPNSSKIRDAGVGKPADGKSGLRAAVQIHQLAGRKPYSGCLHQRVNRREQIHVRIQQEYEFGFRAGCATPWLTAAANPRFS